MGEVKKKKKIKGQGKEDTGKHAEWRRGKEKGKTVWTVELVIYSTFGPEAFLTNYTQPSKPGCKYISNQLNMSLFTARTSQKAPKQ